MYTCIYTFTCMLYIYIYIYIYMCIYICIRRTTSCAARRAWSQRRAARAPGARLPCRPPQPSHPPHPFHPCRRGEGEGGKGKGGGGGCGGVAPSCGGSRVPQWGRMCILSWLASWWWCACCIGLLNRGCWNGSNLQLCGRGCSMPLLSEHGTRKTVTARFWPWRSGRS